MSLFDDALLVTRRQVGFEHVQIARHHFFEHGEAIGDQFWSHQIDILLQHGGIQYRLGFSAINRRHGALLFITGIPELLDHRRQGGYRQRLAEHIVHTGLEILFFIFQHVCGQRHQWRQLVRSIFARQLAGDIQPGHVR